MKIRNLSVLLYFNNIHMLKIRNYSQTDYQQVKNILQEVGLFYQDWHSKENLKSMVEKDTKLIQIAAQNDKIIGIILIIPFGKNVVNLYSLAVLKKYQKQGIGSKLIKHCEEILKKRGTTNFSLFVTSQNKKLINFYQKCGYITSGTNYIYMWKDS